MKLKNLIKQRGSKLRITTKFAASYAIKQQQKKVVQSLLYPLTIGILLTFSSQVIYAQSDSVMYYKVENLLDSCFTLQSSDRNAALLMAKKASSLAKQTQSWHQLAVALECQGIINFYLGTFDTAATYLKQAKLYYLKSRSFKGLASIYNNLGLLEQGRGNYPKAKALFKEALKADSRAIDLIGKSYTINNLGTIYYHIGIGDSALRFFEQAKQLALHLNDTAGIINYHTNIALLLKDQKHFEEAKQHLTTAESLCHTIGDKSGELITQFNRGDLYFEQGDFSTAKSIYTNCLQESEQFNDAELCTHCLLAIGNIFQKELKLKESNEWYQKALKETEQYKNNQLICNILTKMGINFSLDTEFAKALSYYRLSLQIAKRNGLLLEISENYKEMTIVAAKFLPNDSANLYIENYAASRYYGNPGLTIEHIDNQTLNSKEIPVDLKRFSNLNLAIKFILILALLFSGLALAPIVIRWLAKKKDESAANSHNNGL